MNITTDSDRGRDGLDVGFLLQNFFCLVINEEEEFILISINETKSRKVFQIARLMKYSRYSTIGPRTKEGSTIRQKPTDKRDQLSMPYSTNNLLTLSHKTFTSFSVNVPPPLRRPICSSSWSTSGLGMVRKGSLVAFRFEIQVVWGVGCRSSGHQCKLARGLSYCLNPPLPPLFPSKFRPLDLK